MSSVDELKAKGNAAFSAGNFKEALEAFSSAIELDPANHVLYSNRSGAYAAMADFDSAKKDAELCIEKKADWFKGYSRLGAAYHGLKQFDEAAQQYEKALGFAPESNKAGVQSSLQDVKRDQQQQQQQGAANPFAKIFGPDVLAKIAGNAKLAPMLAKPGFVQKIQMIQQNPSLIQGMMQDQDIMTCFIELMGLQSQFKADGAANPDAAAAAPGDSEEARKRAEWEAKEAEMRRESAARRQRDEEDARKKKQEDEKNKKEAASKAQSPAELAKAEGNKLYLARNFDEALKKYDEAFELDNKNTVYLLNRTAVLFEQAKYEEAMSECEKALDHGRENKADYTVVGKLMTRKASCLQKLNQHDEAIKIFNSALLEHRNADTLKKLQLCRDEKKRLEEEAYFSPELSLKAKDEGNVLFKEGKFPEAVERYTEAVKRNPKDHIPYSNRAGALIKLMAFEDAIKDCDKALEIKPDFVRAFARKGQAFLLTKQNHKSLKAYEEGLKIDPENAECKEGRMRCMMKIQEVSGSAGDEETAARAMQDPEIQGILGDSYMQMVLQEVQRNPQRLNDYMKDARIATNINKLIAAGVIRTGPGPAPGGR